MVLFVLRKLIFQTCMHSHPVGLDVWFLVGPFVYFYTSCVQTAKALARLRRCAGSPELLLVAYVVSTIISWAGSFVVMNAQECCNKTTSLWLSLDKCKKLWFGCPKASFGGISPSFSPQKVWRGYKRGSSYWEMYGTPNLLEKWRY